MADTKIMLFIWVVLSFGLFFVLGLFSRLIFAPVSQFPSGGGIGGSASYFFTCLFKAWLIVSAAGWTLAGGLYWYMWHSTQEIIKFSK